MKIDHAIGIIFLACLIDFVEPEAQAVPLALVLIALIRSAMNQVRRGRPSIDSLESLRTEERSQPQTSYREPRRRVRFLLPRRAEQEVLPELQTPVEVLRHNTRNLLGQERPHQPIPDVPTRYRGRYTSWTDPGTSSEEEEPITVMRRQQRLRNYEIQRQIATAPSPSQVNHPNFEEWQNRRRSLDRALALEAREILRQQSTTDVPTDYEPSEEEI